MKQPLLSIVIANYNYGRFLEDAIRSIVGQELAEKIELIVCDAASTDNSVDIIKKYEERITWWCSEPDGGQSAAFNKGFSHARGRFLTWLNADDVMMPGTLKSLEIAVSENPTCEWYVGGVMWLDVNMHILSMYRGRPFSEARNRCGSVSVWGPSSFFTKRLLDAVGGVDERFCYTMDTDLWRKFAKMGARYLPFADYAWGLRLHEGAKMSGHNFPGTLDALPEHPKWKQIAKENKWTDESCPHDKEMSLVGRALSASWSKVLAGKLDSFRYRGRYYMEYYK